MPQDNNAEKNGHVLFIIFTNKNVVVTKRIYVKNINDHE